MKPDEKACVSHFALADTVCKFVFESVSRLKRKSILNGSALFAIVSMI